MMAPGCAPALRSARLTMRALRAEDAGPIKALVDDFEVARWMSRIPHPYRVEDALTFIEDVAPHEVAWVIEVAGSSVAGIGGFVHLIGGTDLELGYWLGRPFWGSGYATEAVGLMLEYAWLCGLPCVRSGHFEGNDRSRRVLEKSGFREVGRSTRFCLARGYDVPHLDMLADRPDK